MKQRGRIVVSRATKPGRARAILSSSDIHKLAEDGPVRVRMVLYAESRRNPKRRIVTIERSTSFDCFDGSDVMRVQSALAATADNLDDR